MRIRIGVATAILVVVATKVVSQECDPFGIPFPCMAGMCQDGQCVGVPLNSGSCDDFEDCTTNDTCVDGECRGTPRTGACDDFNECTLNDTCMNEDGQASCFGSTSADPGTPCASGCGVCQQIAPFPGLPTVCRPAEGKLGMPCELQGLDDLGPCFVGNCTAPAGQIGACSPMPRECPDDGNLCTGEFCNFETGECESSPLPLDCFPLECRRCEPSTGACLPTNVGGSCDDRDTCTDSTVCTAEGACLAGAPQQTATPTRTSGGNTPTPTGSAGPGTPTNTVVVNTPTPTRTLGTPPPTPTSGRCVGDCDGNGAVRVNELVTGVNIVLDRADLSECPEFDTNGNSGVEVNELVAGVNSLIRGCVGAAALTR